MWGLGLGGSEEGWGEDVDEKMFSAVSWIFIFSLEIYDRLYQHISFFFFFSFLSFFLSSFTRKLVYYNFSFQLSLHLNFDLYSPIQLIQSSIYSIIYFCSLIVHSHFLETPPNILGSEILVFSREKKIPRITVGFLISVRFEKWIPVSLLLPFSNEKLFLLVSLFFPRLVRSILVALKRGVLIEDVLNEICDLVERLWIFVEVWMMFWFLIFDFFNSRFYLLCSYAALAKISLFYVLHQRSLSLQHLVSLHSHPLTLSTHHSNHRSPTGIPAGLENVIVWKNELN